MTRFKPWAGASFDVLEAEIRGKNGSLFLFAGLSQHTVESIKSFEGVDICWLEEAQVITKRSFDVLLPTIREGWIRSVAQPEPGHGNGRDVSAVCRQPATECAGGTGELEG